MKHLEHIGIAVKDMEAAKELFTKLLNTEPYKEETVESESVMTVFFMIGQVKIELLQSTDEEGPIARHIERRGEGLHHLAFEVEDIRKEMHRLEDQGFKLLNAEPKAGADNKEIAFIHPKSAGGILLEICQEIDSRIEEERVVRRS